MQVLSYIFLLVSFVISLGCDDDIEPNINFPIPAVPLLSFHSQDSLLTVKLPRPPIGWKRQVHWYRGEKHIPSQTPQTYRVSRIDRETRIKVGVAFTKDLLKTREVFSKEQVFQPLTNPPISDESFDETLTQPQWVHLDFRALEGFAVVSSSTPPLGFDKKVLWYRSGIPFELSGDTCFISPQDWGETLWAGVHFIKGKKRTREVRSQPVSVHIPLPPSPILSYDTLGQKFIIHHLPSAPTSWQREFRWYRDHDEVIGAKSTTYPFSYFLDWGKDIRLAVRFLKPGGDARKISPWSYSTKIRNTYIPKPSKAHLGWDVTSSFLRIDVSDAPGFWNTEIYWYRDGVFASKTNAKSYNISGADVGKRISAKVRFVLNSLYSDDIFSNGIDVSPPAPTKHSPHTKFVGGVDFTPSGEVISISKDNTMKLWDVARVKHTFSPDHIEAPYDLTVSRDGKYAVSGVGASANLWDMSTRTRIRAWKACVGGGGINMYAGRVAFSDDSKYIAITCNSSSPNKEYTKIWDLTSGKTVNTITTKSVGPMAFHPDGKSLLITKGVSRIGSFSHEPFFIDILTGREVFHYRGPSLRHVSTIFSVALIPGGKKFVATGIDGHVYVWSVGVKEGKIIKTLPHWGKDIEAFPDGKHIAVACADGNVYILDLDGKTIATLKANRVEEIAISRDGNRLVVAPYDATDPKLTLWYVGHHF